MHRIALCLALAAASSLASAGCLPIIGTVQLTPEPAGTCTVATDPGMQGQPFLGNVDPAQPGCFKSVVKLVGLPIAQGYSGVTSEAITGGLPPHGVTYSPAGVQGNRALLTARSTLSMGGTRLYAAEVIIESGNGLVTEQSNITGTDGKGLFKNATGGFTIMGNSIGENAQLRGQICTR
jgi:hypothetical protein